MENWSNSWKHFKLFINFEQWIFPLEIFIGSFERLLFFLLIGVPKGLSIEFEGRIGVLILLVNFDISFEDEETASFVEALLCEIG